MNDKSIDRYQKYELIVMGLLTTTIIGGKLISKFAPKAGATIALTSYFAAGIISAGFVAVELVDDFRHK